MEVAIEKSLIDDKVLAEAVSTIIEEGLTEIIPEYSPEQGFTYPVLSDVASKYGVPEIDILEDLVKRGVLKRRPYKRVVECPKCGSTRLVASFRCPECGSTNLSRQTLVAHVTCGYMGVLESMKVEHGKKICPKCNLPLGKPGEDYQVIGAIYACEDCGNRSEMPVPAYECVDCGNVFDHRGAVYTPYYAYDVVLDALLKESKRLLMSLITSELKQRGMVVEVGVTVRGRSGLSHPTDIKVSKDGRDVLIDIVTNQSEYLTVIGKRMDMELGNHIIVVSPTVTMGSIPGQLEARGRIVKARRIEEAVEQTVREVEEVFSSSQ